MSSHDAEVSFSSTVGGEGGGGGGGGRGVAARVGRKGGHPANLAGSSIFHHQCTMTTAHLLVRFCQKPILTGFPMVLSDCALDSGGATVEFRGAGKADELVWSRSFRHV